LADTVKKLASQIEEDYNNKNPLLIGILRGSFVFMTDLRLVDVGQFKLLQY